MPDSGLHLIGGTAPLPTILVNPLALPTEITSTPNTLAAIDGNNAVIRVIVDGSALGPIPSTGIELDVSNSIVRGLIIDGFSTGVSIPNPGEVGDLIQGNDIGVYPLFLVDPVTGFALTGPTSEAIAGQGNSQQGVLLGSTNATVGGVEPQDNNVIIGNGLLQQIPGQGQGVDILSGAQGNQVLGNEIGIVGPTGMGGFFFIVPNGSDGVLIVDSSNYVGGVAPGAGNLISGNLGDGVHIMGAAATRNNVLGNDIGIGPGGGFLFGQGNPGNLGDGVFIDNASDNNIGGNSAAARNVISSNAGAGVRISGASGVRNVVQGNLIGLTADGISALGNSQEGVAIYSADNVVGPSNVISANNQGVLLSVDPVTGNMATGNLVQGNLIGTNSAGNADLGNAQEGVRIDNAPNNTITGNAQGSQVISGNNVGLLIIGSGATGDLVQGNFIGTDLTGTLDLGNSQEGVRIENASKNTIGGTTLTSVNLISANHWGVVITGAGATGNILQGNLIGTDVSGMLSLGNELDGVSINTGASGNSIGGAIPGASNTIAFNRRDGVRIENAGAGNPILNNSIFANANLGIDLVPPGLNQLLSAPVLTSVATAVGFTIVTGRLTNPYGTPTTFTIQYFLNTPTSPPSPIEGQKFVEQTTVTIPAGGTVTFSANVPVILRAGQTITATATDSSGNTSEFSLPAPPEAIASVQFALPGYTVSSGAGTKTIQVTRGPGGSGGYFTVDYSTTNGSAQAGLDYLPTSGTLTFRPRREQSEFPRHDHRQRSVQRERDGQPHPDQSHRRDHPRASEHRGPDHPARPVAAIPDDLLCDQHGRQWSRIAPPGHPQFQLAPHRRRLHHFRHSRLDLGRRSHAGRRL